MVHSKYIVSVCFLISLFFTSQSYMWFHIQSEFQGPPLISPRQCEARRACDFDLRAVYGHTVLHNKKMTSLQPAQLQTQFSPLQKRGRKRGRERRVKLMMFAWRVRSFEPDNGPRCFWPAVFVRDSGPRVIRVSCLRILQATNVCRRPGSLQYYTLTHTVQATQ